MLSTMNEGMKMRKKLFLLITILVMCMPAMGEGIDRNAALKKAQVFMPGKHFVAGKTMRSARAKGARTTDAFYIFNVKDDGGFVIVSGDDRTSDILAYSKHGNLDIDEMPENMKWWLDEYARQIEALDTSLEPVERRAQSYPEAIDPLITTRWDQGAPYNYMCPDGNRVDYDELGYDAEKRCITGCIATALAQIMYYWRWPDTCPALEEYKSTLGPIKALPATTFKWDSMKDTYTSTEIGPSADAVAELMRYAGQATRVNYGLKSTSGWLYLDPIISVFQYSSDLLRRYRSSYDNDSWESKIYNELKARRPVLYFGSGELGGHLFIVDGYDGNGLFHFNWGWSGYLDTYSVLSIADTNEKGNFRYNQWAVIGMEPANDDRQAAIESVDNEPTATGKSLYNLSGRRVEKASRGIYIIRKSDGTTKKVLIK